MRGISNIEAKQKLEKFGFNELPSAKPKTIFSIAFEVIKEPMFVLLISCGLIYIVLGDYREGIILLSTTFIIIGITFYQSSKTEKALDALKKLSSPRALVIRDDEEIRIPGREVVTDDLVILNEGDRVPADGILLEATSLTIDESLLTGESIAVEKNINSIEGLKKVYSGTLVVRGRGIAKITAIGQNTEFGKIGQTLESLNGNETRLQKEMKVLIRNLFVIGACISIGIILLFYFSRGNLIQSILNGIAAAMAILPEEFPVVLTVFLALGAWRLSKINVLTRNPSAIETLGSATVLCSDKTGTITQNKMELVSLYNGTKIINRDQFNSEKSTIYSLIEILHFASSEKSIDPMEKAFSSAYHEFSSSNPINYTLFKEYAFGNELMAMTRVLQNSNTNERLIATKGAPETIVELCKLSQEEKEKVFSVLHQYAEFGYRVLGLAKAEWNQQVLPEQQSEFDFSFLGLAALEDPIRPEVPNAIQECLGAGVKVIMITGDYYETARSIGSKIGLATNGTIITGNELNEMSEDELRQKIKNTSIFARVRPEQKLKIVSALKENGEIVAMTGDGVNDAPALKSANIGISMGKKGTDVAREASSLVLLDDNFASIVAAIRNGRRIFDNLQKAMSYIIAIHIPIIGLTLIPAFYKQLPLFLLPLHIVFMELIIDPVCSLVFESEREERGIMQRAPRSPREKFFGAKKILHSVFKGLLLLVMVLIIYILSFYEGHTEGEVRAIAFSALIIGNVFLILTNLSETRSFITILSEKNVLVATLIPVTLTLLFIIISVPPLQVIFSFEFPGYTHFITSIAGAIILLGILELIKFIKYRKTL